MQRGLVGSEMCIRDRVSTQSTWAKTMAQALAVNKSLCYFDFTYNNIHDDGLSRLGESLDINATLLKLKLFGHNYFGQEALDLFFKLQDKKPTGWVDFQVYIVDDHFDPVSYTHLTLPTILLVQISVVAVSLKKKQPSTYQEHGQK
eukprot:TRINITY_DN20816_c0_g1_i4.p1 TRINITY_DN20816_c0_g1~~TRINITY_DN20816_c0_g1_i4.p1  ORF type:complete len:146 (-),score=43.45 TRINITY_DN20816_c0_g1_i4:15-452(-)